MFKSLKTWCVVGGAILLGLSSSACLQISPSTLVPRFGSSESDVTTDPALTSEGESTSVRLSTDTTSTDPPPASGSASQLGPQNSVVRRGPIEQQMSLTGRVAGAEEVEIAYPGGGKVETLGVRPGETVTEGQLLLRTETTDLQKDLAAAQARLETAALRLQQANAQSASQARAQERDAARRAAEESMRRAQASQDAEVNLRKAQDDFDLVAAGASATERRQAESAVAAAEAALTRTTAERDRLQRGANPDDVRAAERAMASAQTNLDNAQGEVDRLTRGPDPVAVRAAERDVERAQTALRVAEATKADGANVTQAQRDALVANARLSVQDAQDQLSKVKQPADPRDITIAQRNLQVARTAADQARERLDLVRKGPDEATIEAAIQAVNSAETLLANAQDKLDDVNSRPTPAELRAAQDRVNVARAALTRATTAPSSVDVPAVDAGAEFDREILQKGLAQEQANIATLERRLNETKLLAPFDGVVTTVNVRVGDTVDPAHPAVTMTRPGAPVIRIDVSEADAGKLSVGQAASVMLDGAIGEPLSATVVRITSSANGAGRVAQVRVEWPTEVPKIGRTAQLAVALQRKENVLLVPRKAVRTAGQRTYVQYMSGSTRRVANVEVGIMTEHDAEVVSGLSEGQIVLVAP